MGVYSIPGSPEDYYLVKNKPDGTVSYSGVREKIREIVQLQNNEIKLVIAAGGNPHTASLDFTDAINDFIDSAPVEAQVAFYDMYNQEMEAATATTIEQTNKILAESAEKEAVAHNIGTWIGAGILFVFLLFMFGMFK